jgi:hypothetical protein
MGKDATAYSPAEAGRSEASLRFKSAGPIERWRQPFIGEVSTVRLWKANSTITGLRRYTHHYDASARRTADVMGDIFPDEP